MKVTPAGCSARTPMRYRTSCISTTTSRRRWRRWNGAAPRTHVGGVHGRYDVEAHPSIPPFRSVETREASLDSSPAAEQTPRVSAGA